MTNNRSDVAMYELKEDDWQYFRKNVPIWQERFMTSLIGEYTRMLMGKGKGSEKFWNLKKRIEEDVKRKGVVIEMRRSRMVNDVIVLFEEGTITKNDMCGFSEELKRTVESMMELNRNMQ